MNSQQFERIQKDIAEAQTRKDKLEGALEQLKERMVKEYKCSTIVDLQALLDSTNTQLEKLQAKYDKGCTELEAMMNQIA